MDYSYPLDSFLPHNFSHIIRIIQCCSYNIIISNLFTIFSL